MRRTLVDLAARLVRAGHGLLTLPPARSRPMRAAFWLVTGPVLLFVASTLLNVPWAVAGVRWVARTVPPPVIRGTVTAWAAAGMAYILLVDPTLRSRARHRRGLCPRGGYDLRFSPGRCPECGRDQQQGATA